MDYGINIVQHCLEVDQGLLALLTRRKEMDAAIQSDQVPYGADDHKMFRCLSEFLFLSIPFLVKT